VHLLFHYYFTLRAPRDARRCERYDDGRDLQDESYRDKECKCCVYSSDEICDVLYESSRDALRFETYSDARDRQDEGYRTEECKDCVYPTDEVGQLPSEISKNPELDECVVRNASCMSAAMCSLSASLPGLGMAGMRVFDHLNYGDSGLNGCFFKFTCYISVHIGTL
jgi:hypothetical protein